MIASTAPNTLATYKQGLNCYNAFCVEVQGKCIWPPSLNDVVQFVAYMSLKALSFATAKAYLAGISYYCKTQDKPDVTNHFLARKVLEGLRRQKRQNDTRLPITLQLLDRIIKILPNICTNTYETSLFSAAFALAYFALLRVGEVTYTLSNHCISKNDILLNYKDYTIEVKVRHSKTDQLGKGEKVLIPKVLEPVNPFQMIEEFLKKRPGFSGALFCHFGGDPLSRYQFTSVLKKALHYLGMESKNYKSHSFRIGAASDLAQQGKSEDEIKIAGRWKSHAYRSYIRLPH